MRVLTVITLLSLATARPASALDFKEQRHLFELGAFGGVLFLSEKHELLGPGKTHVPYKDLTPEFGARFSYLPLPYFGGEIEGALGLAKTEAGGDGTIWALRGHLIGQYPARVSPFLVVGGGVLGVRDDWDGLGNDQDLVFHWGAGLKFYLSRHVALRIDGRHLVGARYRGTFTNHFEVLGGISAIFNFKEVKDSDGDGLKDPYDACPQVAAKTKNGCPPPDTDGDGVIDSKDKCPTVAAQTDDGCPPPDTDGDGVIDPNDRCPKVPANTSDGCPPPDRDGDGVPDVNDKCPDVAAKTVTGCPLDSDGDGLTDDKDKCPQEPETKNGYEDEDGCPDTLPQKVKRFTGAIRGITFATGKAKIRSRSFAVLDEAVKVLQEYGSLKLEIRGHSDNRGKREFNVELSRRRAQAVADYLISKGVAADRLKVEGLGPDEPVANNRTRSGRAKNRRIEFKPQIN
ncbi:MAG: OmpA family protein [Deltaproteobacteria bacterium]|nr:OmpA family protein [Deltaproteobacteria bacterium]